MICKCPLLRPRGDGDIQAHLKSETKKFPRNLSPCSKAVLVPGMLPCFALLALDLTNL